MQLISRLPHLATQRFGFSWLFTALIALDAAYRQRRHLAEMGATRRDDLGLNDSDIAQELAKPIWSAPRHWIR